MKRVGVRMSGREDVRSSDREHGMRQTRSRDWRLGTESDSKWMLILKGEAGCQSRDGVE